MNKFKQSAFSRFFRFFPKLFTAGLMYSVPLAVFTGIFVLISYLTGFNNVIIWGLGLIPSFPFYAGLVMIIRKYAVEKQEPPLFKTFFTAVKDNLKRFLIHGVVLYMIIAFGMFAILYYYTLSQTDVVFGSVLTIYMIFVAILIVMMFYVPIMEITYELKLKDIYKNAFLLVFGKILRNLIALVFLAAVTAVTILAFVFSRDAMYFVTLAIVVALYPLLYSYISTAIISKGLQDSVGSFSAKPIDEKKIEEQREQDAIAAASDTSDSDYVFVNGRMIKK
ncbi:MAG: DUF624 domain-containing protein [Ruminococcus bromii]|nr:DUF624 domain-containing protein [Ruminococcus bromii]MCI7211603.1 DUF624 domain-containing protein [Ruminococcus bromii]MDD6433735.1 DUF624 domain-containing protein [Ruminococcus bromii]MDY4085263.1 DUF624 domain-containing protein [Ruminococcus bromii]